MISSYAVLGFLPGIGPQEMFIVGIVAVLLFGKRLPEVGRSLGKSLVEFKKGIRGIEEEIHSATYVDTSSSSRSSSRSVSRYNDIDDREEATAPKFEPPAAEPQSRAAE